MCTHDVKPVPTLLQLMSSKIPGQALGLKVMPIELGLQTPLPFHRCGANYPRGSERGVQVRIRKLRVLHKMVGLSTFRLMLRAAVDVTE